MTPGGILNSSGSSFVGTSTGLTEYSIGKAGDPFFNSTGGAQHYLVLVNPLPGAGAVTVNPFSTSGNPSTGINRTLSGRGLLALSIPGVFPQTPTTPTSGSLAMLGASYLGWYLQVFANGKVIFNPIGLDTDDTALIPLAAAP